MNARKEPREFSYEKGVSSLPEKTLEREVPATISPKEKLHRLLKVYLDSNPTVKNPSEGVSELEVRFGTQSAHPITKIHWNRVVQELLSCGFQTENLDGVQMLRIIPKVRDAETGQYRTDKIRVELVGTDMIQEYCKTNSVEKIQRQSSFYYHKMKMTQKAMPKNLKNIPVVGGGGGSGDFQSNTVDFKDFEFRVSYNMEKDFSAGTGFVAAIIREDEWQNTKKLFRCMNRVQFSHPDFPILADLSIVKSSMRKRDDRTKMLEFLTVQQAEVFKRPESYEIELEIDNSRVGPGTAWDTSEKLGKAIRQVVRIVMNGLQNTRYPIGLAEKEGVLRSYMQLIHGDSWNGPRVLSRNFIGPSSISIQMENVVPLDKAVAGIPNIRRYYTVTDKADGERRLLFVAPKTGRVYMIDMNMNVMFTGMVATEKELFDSLLDGEYIAYDRHRNWINRYAAFDVYYLGERDRKRESEGRDARATASHGGQREFRHEEQRDVKSGGGRGSGDDSMRREGGVRVEGEGEREVEETIWKRSSSVREYPFVLEDEDVEEKEMGVRSKNAASDVELEVGAVEKSGKEKEQLRNSRLYLLRRFVETVRLVSVLGGSGDESVVDTGTKRGEFQLYFKTFYVASQIAGEEGENIFELCGRLWSKIMDGTYPYQTDGLIFTPRHLPVGCNKVSELCGNTKKKWAWSLKWKPPEMNTLDLLVTYKKDEKGRPEIHTSYLKTAVDLTEWGAVEGGELEREKEFAMNSAETVRNEGRSLNPGAVGGMGTGGTGTGMGTGGSGAIRQYRTLVLCCGSDKYGYLNPWEDMLQEKWPPALRREQEDGREVGPVFGKGQGGKREYYAVPFVGSDPYDPTACYANILLYNAGSELVMRTEEGEFFEDNTIVEFSYDRTRAAGYRWIPLRVRYDKTAELRDPDPRIRNYGNDWTTCDSIWKTLHRPITVEMITTGRGILDMEKLTIGGEEGETVYYSRDLGQKRYESATKGLRDFHNLYVKKKLILGACSLSGGGGRGRGKAMRRRGMGEELGDEEGTKLVDFAVGKGGDLNKFIQAGVSFVYGVDIAKDNIQNVMDGVCARYLEAHRLIGSGKIPLGVFQVGDCTRNLRKGEAFSTEKDLAIARGVFGQGAKQTPVLERMPLIRRVFGWGENGFDVCSCQFALHFFCENALKFHGFMQNLAENVKVGGVFICTTFDGERLFEKLRGVVEGDSWSLYGSGRGGGSGDNQRIFQITKRYAETGFPSDETGLGYAVDVYQESINKTFREYLVHPEFLKNVMFDYGFTLVRREEAEAMGFARGTDTFDALHNEMLKESLGYYGGGRGVGGGNGAVEYGMADKMSREEKAISFLNRYYIFRKRHAVEASEVLRQRRKKTQAEGVWMKKVMDEVTELGDVDSLGEGEISKKEEKKGKFRKIAKLGRVVLGDYSPVGDVDTSVPTTTGPATESKEPAAASAATVVEETSAIVSNVPEPPKPKMLRTTMKRLRK